MVLALAVFGAVVFSLFLVGLQPAELKRYEGKTLRAWVLQLDSPDQPPRDEAARVLKAQGAPLVKGLVRLLEARDSLWRKFAWKRPSPLPASVSRTLTRKVAQPDARLLRAGAAQALGLIGPPAAAAIPALGRALSDPDAQVRQNSALALSRFGRAALPVLEQALDAPNPDVRRLAVYTLGELGPDADSAGLRLIKALADTDENVRRSAAHCLARLGPTTLPAVSNALVNGDRLTRLGAGRAVILLHLPSNAVAPQVAILAKDPDPVLRQQGVETLDSLAQRRLVQKKPGP